MDLTTQIPAGDGDATSMKDLLSRVGFDLPKVGDTIEGEILSISKNNVFVDLGSFGTGIVYPGEFYDNPNAQKSLKTGQQISSIMLDIETDDGFRELSLKKAQKTTAWQTIKKLKDSGETVTTPIININKGGAIIEINGIQGFLPLSQLSNEHYPKVEGGDTTKIVQALQKLKNKEIKIRVLDFNEAENKLIVSEKAISDDEVKKKIGQFNVGDIIDGTVTGITDFGAFVSIQIPIQDNEQAAEDSKQIINDEEPKEISPVASPSPSEDAPREPNAEAPSLETRTVEGLIHISEIDWKLIDNPRDHLKKGQQIKAKIIGIDGTKISLSLKALKSDPWKEAGDKYSVGQTLEVMITKVNNYGALAALDEEITGLIPASEFAGKKPGDIVTPGDKVSIAIVSIDQENHKMLLTLAGKEKPEPEPNKTDAKETIKEPSGDTVVAN